MLEGRGREGVWQHGHYSLPHPAATHPLCARGIQRSKLTDQSGWCQKIPSPDEGPNLIGTQRGWEAGHHISSCTVNLGEHQQRSKRFCACQGLKILEVGGEKRIKKTLWVLFSDKDYGAKKYMKCRINRPAWPLLPANCKTFQGHA